MKKPSKSKGGVSSLKTPLKLHQRISFTYKFVLRKQKKVSGKNVYPIYFQAFVLRRKKEFATGVHSTIEDWDETKEQIKGKGKSIEESNLMLSHIKSKAHNIIARYFVANKPLEWDSFLKELRANVSSDNFLDYFANKIDECESRDIIGQQTANTHRVILRRCERFNAHWPFHSLNSEWFEKFENNLIKELKHKERTSGIRLKNEGYNTINITKKVVKTYLLKAKKDSFDFEVPSIKINFTKTARTYLTQEELSRLVKSYKNKIYDEKNIKSKALKMFLFSTCTGLRISDIKRFNSDFVKDDLIHITPKKTKKQQITVQIPLTKFAKELVSDHDGSDFRKYSEPKINEALKSIASDHNINKEISMNVGRHTFATLFLEKSNNLKALMDILGHQNIRTTQNYLHVNTSFLKSEMDRMEDLFD